MGVNVDKLIGKESAPPHVLAIPSAYRQQTGIRHGSATLHRLVQVPLNLMFGRMSQFVF